MSLNDEYFMKFKNIIHEKSGIFFDNVNRSILESRLRERMRQKQIENHSEYYELVSTNNDELETLLDSVTTNLTKFFRNDRHFNALRTHIIPDIISRNESKKQIKIWSAGCSTGEEPYSVVMEILSALGTKSNLWRIDVLASDISLKSLMKAKIGYYPKERTENIPNEYKGKYLIEEKEGYKVKDDVKKFIRFDYHNLKNDNGERGFDLIFCRNVIIYFDKTEQERVVNHFYQCLATPGYLLIGHSESLFGMSTSFNPEKIAENIIYMKK